MKKLFLGAMLFFSFGAWAQKKTKVDPATALIYANKETAINALNSAYDADKKTALQIWDFAEVGYKEVKSAALHIQHLRDAGFTVETGVAGIPTAFVATYGTGSPAIGILAEYDALPGINQSASSERDPIAGKNAGHACGHHLFGTASVSAGIAIKELNVYRQKYISNYLSTEIGAISAMEQNVISSLKEDKSIVSIVEDEDEVRKFGQKVADKVADFGGSWTFIISFVVFIANFNN